MQTAAQQLLLLLLLLDCGVVAAVVCLRLSVCLVVCAHKCMTHNVFIFMYMRRAKRNPEDRII